jgi:hypothetical protein
MADEPFLLVDEYARSRNELLQSVARIMDEQKESLKTRIDTIEKTFERFVEERNVTPTLIDREIEHVRRYINEIYLSIQNRLSDREIRFTSVTEERNSHVEAEIKSLQIMMRTMFDSAERSVATALESAERSVSKAEIATDKRFESVNEFRHALNDLSARMAQRQEVDVRFLSVISRVESLGTIVNGHVTRGEHESLSSSLSKIELDLRTYHVGSVHRDDLVPIMTAIEKLRDSDARTGGKSQGIAIVLSSGIAIVAVLVSLVSVFYNNHSSAPTEPSSFTVGDAAIINELRQNRSAIQNQHDSPIITIPGTALPTK